MPKHTNLYRYHKIVGEDLQGKMTSKYEKIEMTQSQVKNEIMNIHGWTKEEYKKHYDIFKNKLRAFEAFEASHGVKKKKQSAVELLYKQAKTMQREGPAYQPSLTMQRIQKFSSISSGKAGQKALTGKKYQARKSALYSDYTNKRFEGFVTGNTLATEIVEKVTDPVQREKALSDLADKLHAKRDEQERVMRETGEPYKGDMVGSTDSIDFDINDYL